MSASRLSFWFVVACFFFPFSFFSPRHARAHLARVDAVRPERQPDDVDEPHANQADGVHLLFRCESRKAKGEGGRERGRQQTRETSGKKPKESKDC